jgi:TetR/AcrR family transcriptional regulator, transcriptional repressor for nem operon
MGHSQAAKLATHERIVDIAAKRFREHGIDGVSIADLMNEAGLTAGGFYKHFESRDQLVKEAFERALRDIETWENSIPTAPRHAMRAYVSASHRDNVERGCPISALVNDMSRATEDTRAIYTEHVRNIVEQIAKASPAEDNASKRAEALHMLSACVGAVTLSRAVSDEQLSAQLLDGALNGVLELLSSKRK